MRMNKSFEKRWNAGNLDLRLTGVVVHPRLSAIIHAAFLRQDGCLLLSPYARQESGLSNFPDRTGYEVSVNEIYVNDLIANEADTAGGGTELLLLQGVKAALILSDRLRREGKYRVVVSLDHELPSLTIFFYERRAGEIWCLDDPNEYQVNDVMIIDT